MSNALTKDERHRVEVCRENNACSLVPIIDRLVAEVERLRERSAMLELRGDLHLVFATMPGPDGAEFVKAALAALSHPEAPDRKEAGA